MGLGYRKEKNQLARYVLFLFKYISSLKEIKTSVFNAISVLCGRFLNEYVRRSITNEEKYV
jgi:hypothetical protein